MSAIDTIHCVSFTASGVPNSTLHTRIPDGDCLQRIFSFFLDLKPAIMRASDNREVTPEEIIFVDGNSLDNEEEINLFELLEMLGVILSKDARVELPEMKEDHE